MAAKKVFISYSHKDAAHLETLKTHLKPLERAGLISPWFDGYLIPGDELDDKIGVALENAEIVLLLVSPDFLASDYCYTVEMGTALARHDRGDARVVPIIVRECLWRTTPFSRLLSVPTDGKAVMSLHWPDKDEAWRIVAEGIQAAANATVSTKQADEGLAPISKRSDHMASIPHTSVTPMRVTSKRTFTDKDKDDFKHSAYDDIARRFEASIDALGNDLEGSFRRIDANRFTAAIYKNGKKKAGFTVWMGGSHSIGEGISYHCDDSGDTGTLNDTLSVDISDGALVLTPLMGMRGFGDEGSLKADDAAEYLWGKFVERIA